MALFIVLGGQPGSAGSTTTRADSPGTLELAREPARWRRGGSVYSDLPRNTAGNGGTTGSNVQVMRTADNAVHARNTIGNGGWVQETDPATSDLVDVG